MERSADKNNNLVKIRLSNSETVLDNFTKVQVVLGKGIRIK